MKVLLLGLVLVKVLLLEQEDSFILLLGIVSSCFSKSTQLSPCSSVVPMLEQGDNAVLAWGQCCPLARRAGGQHCPSRRTVVRAGGQACPSRRTVVRAGGHAFRAGGHLSAVTVLVQNAHVRTYQIFFKKLFQVTII